MSERSQAPFCSLPHKFSAQPEDLNRCDRRPGGRQQPTSPVGKPPSRSGLALFAHLMDEMVLSILNLPPKALELRRDALARCAYAARCVYGERPLLAAPRKTQGRL